MSVEENLKLAAEREEAFNAQDWDRFFGFHDESLVVYAPGAPEPLKGLQAYKEWIQGFITAFPDFHSESTSAFGQGDWLCWEHAAVGTHTGPMATSDGSEIPATNKTVQFTSATVLKVEGGKVTEIHPYFDQLGFMMQLGLAPE